MTAAVYVVVLNWNGWRDTIACIATLQKQDYLNLSLLVVDNGSTDESVAHIARIIPGVELIKTGANVGFGVGGGAEGKGSRMGSGGGGSGDFGDGIA